MTLIRVIDTETTGFEDPAEMVEIGWTDIISTGDGWRLSGPHSLLVDPGMPISYPAMAVHHITGDMVVGARRPDDVRLDIVRGVDILCAHNAAFDARFIRGHDLPWVCTLKAARTLWPDLQGYGNGAIRYERGLCPHDARALPSHRAGPDTWVTAHILLDLLREASVERLVEIAENPVLQIKVDFGEHAGKLWSDVPDSYLDWILKKSNMPSDPKKEDAVFTARQEVKRRKAALAAVDELVSDQPGLLDQPASSACEDTKGGPLARRAAIACGERPFQVFLNVDSPAQAVAQIYRRCGVDSRKKLDHNDRAAAIWRDIDGKYRLWLEGHDVELD